MRIWSLHPSSLDRVGLVACWRETLLAQAVLADATKGYRNHPQLLRFRRTENPIGAVGVYLAGLAEEATRRGYKFNASKITSRDFDDKLTVTQGQLDYEWQHLGAKLAVRSPEDALRWQTTAAAPHPLFTVVPGDIEGWERT